MTDQELLYTIALTRIPRLNSMHHRQLLETLGSATAIYENRHDIRQAIPDASDAMRTTISSMDTYLSRAEEELSFTRQKHIDCLVMGEANYPSRLLECPDAPVLLYYRGSADLNTQHIISIVGTRQITDYGKDLCRTFIKDLKTLCPDALIVSGLAYGVDIHAHRNALQQGMQTVGVVAHGMDQIYPRLHRDTAIEMLEHGGLLTEYPSRTAIDKMNFVARNRIVAGMADATIVVESAAKGGSLITACIARDYNKEVFAFPGRTTDACSAGCNALIYNNQATLLLGAKDFMNAMGWISHDEQNQLKQQNAQMNLFPTLSPEEQRIVTVLKNTDGKANNQISIESGIPMAQLSGLLFSMEMKGIVKMMNGGIYRLL